MADTPTSPPRAGPARDRAALEPGRVFAGHEILREAGRGGMGVVYAARHAALRVVRALKVLTDETAHEPVFRARFTRESQLAAALEHPNVVQVYEAGESEGTLYLSMRFVDGPNLAELFAGGPLSAEQVADIVGQVAAALDAAHDAGLVHRDVKPANVMVEDAPAGRRAFLGDFGISRMLAATGRLTETGEMLGTVDYVAPEQIAGSAIDGRADVYSLACVGYEALTTRPPFARETRLATMFAHANAPRPAMSAVRPELPAAVDAVLARGLAVDPADRYPRASDLARDLRAALAGERVTVPAPRSRRPGNATIAAIAVVAALAATAAGLAVAGVFGGSADPADPGSARLLPAPPAKVVGAVGLPHPASSLAIGELNLWTASAHAQEIAAVVPVTADRSRPPIPIHARPSSIVAGFGSVWITEPSADALVRIDPGQGSRSVRIPVGDRPTDVAASGSHLWVANEGDDTVSRIDPLANRVDETARAGDAPVSLAVGEGGVWIADSGSGRLANLDPASAKPQAKPIRLGGEPAAVIAGEAGVWVVDERGRLLRVSPGSGDVQPVPGIADAVAVTTGFGYAWVATANGLVERVDPAQLRPAGEPVRVGGRPVAIAAGDGFVWTADARAPKLTRIDPSAG